MQSTTGYSRGDVVLVQFIFSEETGSKRRPVLLLSSEQYMRGRQEVVVSAITSNTRRLLTGDHLMIDWEEAGGCGASGELLPDPEEMMSSVYLAEYYDWRLPNREELASLLDLSTATPAVTPAPSDKDPDDAMPVDL